MPANHPHMVMEKRPTVSTVTSTLMVPCTIHGLMAMPRQSATQKTTLDPGLPLTTKLWSPFKGLRYSTEAIAVGSELEMLKFASRTSSQLLAAKCSLAATTLAVLLDLLLLGNTLSSQVKSNCEIVIADHR